MTLPSTTTEVELDPEQLRQLLEAYCDEVPQATVRVTTDGFEGRIDPEGLRRLATRGSFVRARLQYSDEDGRTVRDWLGWRDEGWRLIRCTEEPPPDEAPTPRVEG